MLLYWRGSPAGTKASLLSCGRRLARCTLEVIARANLLRLLATFAELQKCTQDARYGKAVAALLSLGTCPMNADTLKEMQTKHPEAGVSTLPSGSVPEAVRFDVDLVRKKVEGFPTGSAAGASGTRPQFLKDILYVPTRPLRILRWRL